MDVEVPIHREASIGRIRNQTVLRTHNGERRNNESGKDAIMLVENGVLAMENDLVITIWGRVKCIAD